MTISLRRRRLLQLSLLSTIPVLPLHALADARSTLGSSALAAMRDHFLGEIERGHRAGYVYSLARIGGDASLECLGFADLEAGVPMKPDTGFRLASMSKALTSAAAMLLVDRGELAVDQPVADFIPEFAATRVFDGLADDGSLKTAPQAQAMSVFHLMTHTSGLDGLTRLTNPAAQQQGAALFASLASQGDLAVQAARFAEAPLAFQPGEGWGYGVSTDVLGRVVEVVSGQPLETFMRSALLEPLGMDATYFIGPEGGVSDLARMYEKSDSGLREVSHPADGIRWAAGGMGMASTVPDYMNFLRMMASGGVHEGERILSPAAISGLTQNALNAAQMPVNVNTPVSPGAGHSLGFGVVVEDPPSPPPHRVGDYRWGGSSGTAYFVSPNARLYGAIMAQYALSAVPYEGMIEDFESTKDDFSRFAFRSVE